METACVITFTNRKELWAIKEDYSNIVGALQANSIFHKCTDFHDGTEAFIRLSDVMCVSLWTLEGQQACAKLNAEIEEIGKEHERPNWEQ